MQIAIIGATGAGKSTFARRLAEETGLAYRPEPWDLNPYIPQLATDSSSETFYNCEVLQLALMAIHHRQQGILDRTIWETWDIFITPKAPEHPRECADLLYLYNSYLASLRKPDQVIWIDTPPEETLRRIRGRGRDFEQTTTEEDVLTQHKQYERLAARLSATPLSQL